MTDDYKANVPAHGVVVLKIVGKNKLKEIFEGEYAYLNNFNHLKYSKAIPNQAKAVLDSICSGLAKAISIGNNKDNWMEFRDVVAPNDGVYNLTISYLSNENRAMTVTINNQQKIYLKNLNSNSRKKIAEKTIQVKLKKGTNFIRFSNPIALIPDIDKISFKFYESN